MSDKRQRSGLGRQVDHAGVNLVVDRLGRREAAIRIMNDQQPAVGVRQQHWAMIEQAIAKGRKIGLLSTFAPTLASMPREFPASVEIVPKLAEGALAALDRGDRAEHDRLVVQASIDLAGCDLIALAQYSMAPAAALVAGASGRAVLTTPDSAVMKLKEMLRG